MSDVVLIAGAAVIGILVGALLSSKYARVAVQADLDKAQRKTTQAVTVAKQQVGNEMERLEREATGLRAKVDEERHAVEAAHSKLQADVTRMQAERGKLLTRYGELAQGLEELHAQNDESIKELEQLHEIANSLRQVLEQMESRLLAAARRVKELAGTKAS
jgi:chromosome segregation ATPase